MPDLPVGMVTFLFTDIEGSTQRWERHHAARARALARHDALLREAILARGGHVFKTIGDAFQVAFGNPIDALLAAAEAQRALAAEDWSACGDGFPARAQLDGPAWDAAWAEGAAMSEEEAVAYALGEIDPWALGTEKAGAIDE